MKILNVVIGLV